MPRTFTEEFAAARIACRKTLSEIGGEVGLSIGRICDIEKGRYRPPSEYMTAKLEKALGVTDGRLVALANAERQSMPHNIMAAFSARPLLCELVLRLSKLSDDELNKFTEKLDAKDIQNP